MSIDTNGVVWKKRMSLQLCQRRMEKSAAVANIDCKYCIIAKWEIWRYQMILLLQRWLNRCNQREIEAQGWILKLVFMFLSNNASSIEWGYGDIAQSVGTSQPHPQNGTRDRIRIPRSGKRLGWRKKNILAGWPCLAEARAWWCRDLSSPAPSDLHCYKSAMNWWVQLPFIISVFKGSA